MHMQISMMDISYIPELDGNLLLVKQLTNNEFSAHFHRKECTIQKGKDVQGNCKRPSIYLMTEDEVARTAAQSFHNKCIHFWHRCLRHRYPEAVKEFGNRDLIKDPVISTCPTGMKFLCCIKAKVTLAPLPKNSQKKIKHPLESTVIYEDQ